MGDTTPLDDASIDSYRDRFARHLSQTVPGRKEFVVARAHGCTLTAADGRDYLDMTSGIAVANVGHTHPDVVAAIKDACSEAEVEPPTIVSESGRALASHQSILVFDVLGASDVPKGKPYEPVEEDHLVLHNMYETLQTLGPNNFQEMYHDAQQFKKEAISLFNFGYLSLEQRSRAERLYWTICRRILEEMKAQELETEEKIALGKSPSRCKIGSFPHHHP